MRSAAAAFGRVLAAALLAILALTSVHGAASTAAPAGAIAQGPASISAAVVHAAPAVATQDHRQDLTPVPENALPPRADAAPAAVAEPDAALPVAVSSAPHSSRAPPTLH